MERITHNLVQGTAEWLAYRSTMDNGSDAAAMLGCSPHKTRNQLLQERYLGLQGEVSDYVQKIVLDPGHEFEALARGVAETIMDTELFPVVMSLGTLSTSLDGLSTNDRQTWEHKRLNDMLRAVMPGEFNNGADLPKYHRIQMEHGLHVSGAEECLFTASEWYADGTLKDARHAWYYPDAELRAEILAGWEQFHKDLAVYVPPKAEPPKPVGKTLAALPALRALVKGEVTDTNVDEWKANALSVIGQVNRTLKTDEDFATAANMVKWCEKAEDACEQARVHILSQTADIATILASLVEVQDRSRDLRLDLDKLVERRKKEIKESVVADAVAALHQHTAELNSELAPYRLPAIPADFQTAAKNKRTVESLRNAVDTELARVKIASSDTAGKMRLAIAKINAHPEFAFLFNDAPTLIMKDAEALDLIVKGRIEAHKEAKRAEEEATRARIAAEEKEKAEAAARAQAAELVRQEREAQEARDREAKAEADRQAESEAAERRRQDEEARRERERADADLKKLEAPAPSPAAESIVSSRLESFEVVSHADTIHHFNRIVDTIQNNVPEVAKVLAADEPANVSLGKIADCLGFRLDEAFITETLGVPWRKKDRSARLWSVSDYELIRLALIKHLGQACYIPF